MPGDEMILMTQNLQAQGDKYGEIERKSTVKRTVLDACNPDIRNSRVHYFVFG